MNALGWVTLFAKFAEVAEGIVDSFIEKHPELRAAPKEASDQKIDNAIDELIDAKFAKDDPYDGED
jgi:hypothetical protein